MNLDSDANDSIETEHPLWVRDRIELKSVGIDIGSSTSHLVFSTLELRRQGAVLSSRFELANRKVDYQSDILLTPFVDGTSIDTEALRIFFDQAYAQAGISPSDVHTGAVITTGDAARKDNAAAIVELFSQHAGKFVCASAGPMLEAKMAAYGSGAVGASASGDGSKTVLNIDMGGGTAKLAVAVDGRIVETAAINVGARLVTYDDQNIVTKIENAAKIVARHLGLDLQVGSQLESETRLKLAQALAQSLMEVASRVKLSQLTADLMITPPLAFSGLVDAIYCSGGVAEYIYDAETRSYGDIGAVLAQSLRDFLPQFLPGIKLSIPNQRIRSTVIGASQFTAQVSGNTIYVGNAELLPCRNLKAVYARLDSVSPLREEIATAITAELEKAEVSSADEDIALAVRWPHGPAYRAVDALCRGAADALSTFVRLKRPIVIILDCDIARLVGAHLCRVLGNYQDIVCIDGVQLQDFDYVDISEENPEARVVTVLIKSLVFSG